MAGRLSYRHQEYKRVRGRIFWVLVVLWVAGMFHLSNQKRQASIEEHIRCRNSTGVNATACATGSLLFGDDGVANVGHTFNVLGAMLFAPLMFFPARFLARRYVNVSERRAERQEEREQRTMLREQERQSMRRIAASEQHAAGESQRIRRSEVILALGSINDLLDVMEGEGDADRRMQIRLGVAQALRDLAARYDIATLSALIRSDEVVGHTTDAVIARLSTSSLSNLTELRVISLAVSR